MGAKQGVHDFLRAYFHVKSADWKGHPFPLKAFSATELAKMPRYYIMDLDKTMPENVAPDMPTPEEIAANTWLTDEELRVYSSEFGRTSFQGGLNSYRLQTDPSFSAELRLYSGATIDVPSMFISGKSDWGAFQRAGAWRRCATRSAPICGASTCWMAPGTGSSRSSRRLSSSC